jgi:hypothetical protein
MPIEANGGNCRDECGLIARSIGVAMEQEKKREEIKLFERSMFKRVGSKNLVEKPTHCFRTKGNRFGQRNREDHQSGRSRESIQSLFSLNCMLVLNSADT